MIERVSYTPEAAEDLADAYAWYESREPGLGEESLRCVDACVLAMRRHPQIFPPVAAEFRRALIRRFPYEIFYEPTPTIITIYSVFHCSQDPQQWQERLGD